MQAYTPDVPPKVWKTIRGFVLDCAQASALVTELPPMKLLKVIAPFVAWCVGERGLPQDARVLFQPHVIDLYCRTLSGVTDGTRGSYRSTLRNGTRAFLPGVIPAATEFKRHDVRAPYSATAMREWATWARGQRSARLRERAALYLGLVAGAGLMPGEIATVEREDVDVDSQGVLIRVRGARARMVPVLRDYERQVAKVRDARAPGELLWGTPKRGKPNPNIINAFTSETGGESPNHARLRATWIVTHLTLGTPMKDLFRAGGFRQLSNLNEYLEYVVGAADDDYRRLLRGGRR